MLIRILVALEAFQHIVAIGIARLGSRDGRVMRAGAAAADEHHQRFLVYLLLQLRNEMRVGFHAGIGGPFD